MSHLFVFFVGVKLLRTMKGRRSCISYLCARSAPATILLRATDTPHPLALKAMVSFAAIIHNHNACPKFCLFLFPYMVRPSLMFQTEAEVLVISIQNVSEGGQSYLRVRLQCNSMDLAAELVQDLGKYFKLDELESEADFPAEFREFEEVTSFFVLYSCC